MKYSVNLFFSKLVSLFSLILLGLSFNNCEDEASTDLKATLNANFNIYSMADDDTITIYAGDSVRFESTTRVLLKERIWKFPGGSPNAETYATDEPITKFIKYNTPGIYDVTLVVVGINQSTANDTFTRPGYIQVLGDTNSTNSCDSTVRDIDGNVYTVVKIGSECWMQQNLKTTRYNTSETIPSGLDETAWSNDVTGAYAYYNNNQSYITTHGIFYNYFAVATGKLCPQGWHIPTKAEFESLIALIGGEANGGALKIDDNSYWYPPNTGATNSSGFKAIGSGFRVNNGSYYGLGLEGHFWSSTGKVDGGAFNLYMKNDQGYVSLEGYPPENGFSCRCIKD